MNRLAQSIGMLLLMLPNGCVDPCNGSTSLCGKPVTDVVFPTTHNANAALEYGYASVNANHTSGIQAQLEDGIRAMLLDVTYYQGETTLCHSICELGNTPHAEALSWVAAFLDENPREVLVFLYQDSISMEDLSLDFETANLLNRVYAHDQTTPWPTLDQLIRTNKRLIVTTEHGEAPPEWVHHLWDIAWDTPYTFKSVSEFTCTPNRGTAGNSFFLLNHWLSDQFGLPSQPAASVANIHEVLYGRAVQCWEESGQRPNFIAVDWYEQGSLFQAVEQLNSHSF